MYASSEIRALINNEDAIRFFNKEYVSTSISIPKEVRDKLGIEIFNDEQLLECLKDSSWVKEHRDNWFIDLYILLCKRFIESPDVINELKKLPIIKLESGDVSSTDKSIIFLPLSSSINYGFEDELLTINKRIYTIILKKQNENKNQRIIELLDKLNVQSPKPDTIIDHILKIYEEDYNGLESKSDVKLLGYLKYIKENLPEYLAQSGHDNGPERLKKSILIKTKQIGSNWSSNEHPDNIYLSREYGNSYGLEDLFKDVNVHYVNDIYLSEASEFEKQAIELENQLKYKPKNWAKNNKIEYDDILEKIRLLKDNKSALIREWKNFFKKIGVNETPRVVSEEGADRSKYSTITDNKEYKEEKILDWIPAPEFKEILQTDSIDINSCLIHILDEYWGEKYSQYKLLTFQYYYHRKWQLKINTEMVPSN
jgi:hypothetical protein